MGTSLSAIVSAGQKSPSQPEKTSSQGADRTPQSPFGEKLTENSATGKVGSKEIKETRLPFRHFAWCSSQLMPEPTNDLAAR